MQMPSREGRWALTEKEKQTLRLMVRGHDAKSIARELDLSVHTINERLREARRKMSVSSSREAARRLLDVEQARAVAADPENPGDIDFGADRGGAVADQRTAPHVGVGPARRRPRIVIGALLMTVLLGLMAFLTLPQAADAPPPTAAAQATDPQVVDAARRFLAMLDRSDWAASYAATGASFRKLNSLKVWSDASEQARRPLGAVVSRTLIGQENLPAPPAGYEVVRFRTSFAAKADTVETVTLEREDGGWRIVAVTIG
ncbi:DUF4019 domain-containing protein [Sphingomonas sp.]|uniref:helix-turn-helix domain-containing protein n=1 Tax=Sphingomonas sp. TaxID=28214 RepID=UPI001EBF8D11|nr:DUF4019 domain-containing protein [Sphingomonas sp.]MBX3594206.1 DUF4019 domain-containing protein [Sphingomonas sp.]